MKKYADSYKTDFGKRILEKEIELVILELGNCGDILSVGCGPAILETGLAQITGANVIGLDYSGEMIEQSPGIIKIVRGNAEKMNFPNKKFDAVLFVASLEFIKDYKKAIEESVRVLKPKGKFLALILNPESDYFKEKTKKKDSYYRKIKHTDLKEIEKFVSKYFSIEGYYFLGIRGEIVFSSSDKTNSAIYVLSGEKK